MQLISSLVIFGVILCNCVRADVAHLSQPPAPEGSANPYIFSYQAGRAPGHVDRQHTEVSDGSGTVRGAFSYIDPSNQLRTVQYVADENGFHPQLSHELEDTKAVKLGKQKHLALYNKIAKEHADAALAQPEEQQQYDQHQQTHYQRQPVHAVDVVGPQASEAVLRATQKHLSLYDRIAAEHEALGAQQEAERKALEEHGSHLEDGQYHQ